MLKTIQFSFNLFVSLIIILIITTDKYKLHRKKIFKKRQSEVSSMLFLFKTDAFPAKNYDYITYTDLSHILSITRRNSVKFKNEKERRVECNLQNLIKIKYLVLFFAEIQTIDFMLNEYFVGHFSLWGEYFLDKKSLWRDAKFLYNFLWKLFEKDYFIFAKRSF